MPVARSLPPSLTLPRKGGGDKFTLIFLVAVLALSACAPAAREPGGGTGQQPTQPVKKRLVAAALGDVFTVSSYLATGSTGTNQPGISEVEKLVNVGLGTRIGGRIEARLAEAIPTTDNGLWKVFPDGTMETTWKIRPNVFWHDGRPFTTEDLLFTAQASQDREIDFTRSTLFASVERIEAPDPTTLVVKWKSPYIDADRLFASSGTMPMPKHLLEEPYLANRAALPQLSYWNRDFVGTGPYRLREWVPSSHLIVEANDAYVLGRPKIDEIEVRSIPNPNTSVANVLSGAVEVTLGRGLSIDQALAFRDQWRDGRIELSDSGNPTMLGPQFLNPSPPIVADVRFRRALYQALDRQEMANALQGGLVEVAHSGLPFGDPSYDEVQRSVVRYAFDPRRAVQMIEELGYVRAADGMFRDATGQSLPVQVASSTTDLYIRTALASADYWKRVGIDAEPYTVPDARERDFEFRANYPAFEVVSSGSGIDSLNNMWLFYNGHAMAIGNRLVNVTALADTANGHDWDVR